MPGSPTDASETADEGRISVSVADYLWFVDLPLQAMVRIVKELGDELANERPRLRSANSAYVILTHCLGVMEYWGGGTVADRAFERDRAAEFSARGDVGPLVRRVAEARQRLSEDIIGRDWEVAPANVQPDPEDPAPYHEVKGAVLLHILEELYQHLGQMEITRDLLLADHERRT
jgi:Protein of unknown function (DUF664)